MNKQDYIELLTSMFGKDVIENMEQYGELTLEEVKALFFYVQEGGAYDSKSTKDNN